jgi:glyoxylase I family protein
MIKPQGIDHIVLRTVLYHELIDFYCNVLGCKLELSKENLGLTHLRAGNALIDIVDVNGKLGKQGGDAPAELSNNVDHFCLQIESRGEQELQEYLTNCDVLHGEFQDRYGAQGMGRSLYIKDLVGNNLELRFMVSQSR